MNDDISNVIDLVAIKPLDQIAWVARLARAESGANLPTVSNALIILANDPALKGLLSFNEFIDQHLIVRPPPSAEDYSPVLPGPYPRPWGSADIAFIQGYMQRLWSPKFARSTIEDAMVAEASIRRFHPVCGWLDKLVWDGKKRIHTWLMSAFDCENTKLNQAIGSKFLIAAVRRIKYPGTKFDHMMVLEGIQGIGKSTAIKELFTEKWYSDSIPQDLTSKDAAMALLGVWCLEFAEIEHLIKAEVETIKAFLSRAIDRYRPPYAKSYVDRPRQGVLVGTTNSEDYLRDASGNRRIWPVKCRTADPAWIALNREQLWAEAVALEKTGASIWLDDEKLRGDVTEAQEVRMTGDVWQDAIAAWLIGKSDIRIPDVLEFALMVPVERMTKGAEMRVASVLKGFGWKRKTGLRNGALTKFWARDEVQEHTTSIEDEQYEF